MSRLMGNVEIFDCDRASGWVIDPDKPGEPVLVEFVDETGFVLARIAADQPRDDLKDFGFPSSDHGFNVQFSESVFPFARQIVSIRTTQGEDLPGSPVTLRKTSPVFDASVAQWLARAVRGEISTAKTAKDLNPALGVILDMLNDVVDARNALEEQDAASAALRDQPFSGKFADVVQSVRATYPEVVLEASAEPAVSVVIPVFNKFDFTYRCVASLARADIEQSYETIIVDDGSLDETMLSSLVFRGAKIIRNDANLGFIGSCNKGASHARGKYLFFLNNDTEVGEGAIDALVATLENDDSIGVAGAKLLFPDGSLQEAGGIIWRLGDGWNWGRGMDPSAPQYSYLRDADYVSGAALMIGKELFDELDGFDKLYTPAYYEDADLCFRVRQAGKRVVVQPQALVVHFEGATSGTSLASGAKRYQAVNHRKFLARWRHVLASHRLNGERPDLECERHVTRRALFIDDSILTPDQDAGSNAALEHIRSLQRLGYKVTFVPADNMARLEPYTSRLQAIGVECLYHPYYSSVEDAFRESTVKYDIVYLHRYSNASKYIGLAKRYFPGAHIIYSVCDLHYLRLQREAAVRNSAQALDAAEEMRRLELTAINQADTVLVYSTAEADILQKESVAARIGAVPWEIPLDPVTVDVSDRSGVAFIGGYGHGPNVDAAKVLALDLMPLIRKRNASISCRLVGSNMPKEVENLACDDILAVGKVERLETLFAQVRLTVAPLRYGAGIKGKVLYSLAAGVPCVMTSIAAEGLPLFDQLRYLVADSFEEQADKIVRLHSDLDFYRLMAQAGLAFIGQHYSRGAIDAGLRQLIAGKAGS